MANKSSSDLELWEAIQKDDENAFRLFFDRHWERVYRAVFLITKDTEVCLEIVNDIFLNLWLKRHTLSISFFKTYLTTSARYHVYKHRKVNKKNAFTFIEDSEDLTNLSTNNNGDEHIRYDELESHLARNLYVLPKRCKEIFTLSRTDNMSNDEIAKHLSISKRTVENQITHALHYLRLALKSFL